MLSRCYSVSLGVGSPGELRAIVYIVDCFDMGVFVSSTRQLVLATGRLVCLSLSGMLLQYRLRDLPRRFFRLADQLTSPIICLTSLISVRGRDKDEIYSNVRGLPRASR